MISHQYGQKGWDGGGGCIKGSLSGSVPNGWSTALPPGACG